MLRFLPSLFILVAFVPASRAIEPSELKPGLIATYSDSSGASVVRLEPTVAIALGSNESPHPRLKNGDSMRWKGHINAVRAGEYAFTATVQGGKLAVRIGSRSVLEASGGQKAAVHLGKKVAVEGGVQEFEASFTRTGGPAQVELRWQGPGFRNEPIPHRFLGHLAKNRPDQMTKDLQIERGRFHFEEFGCIRCHRPAANDALAKGLVDRSGPNLTEVARRANAGWLDAWLADPSRLRPHTTMPKMFSSDGAGKAERFAIVSFLVSLAGKPLPQQQLPALSKGYRQSMERGSVLFTVTGCSACHTQPTARKPKIEEDDKEPLKPEDSFYSAGTKGPAAKYTLGALGSKFRVDSLAQYLQNPLKTSPAGRMPHMSLSANESLDIARYLCRVTDDTISPAMPAGKGLQPGDISTKVLQASGASPDEVKSFGRLSAANQWAELGKRLARTKGCLNCHAVEPGGKALASQSHFPSLEQIKKAGNAACISDRPSPGVSPAYSFPRGEHRAIAAFLEEGLAGAGSSAPTHSARLAIRRFNCLNCHTKDGEGGIELELIDRMRQMAKAENADDVRPPLLTGIGHKSRTSWLKSVLMQGGRARPWMQLRMPQYGEANVGKLPNSLALLEGLTPDDTIHKAPLSSDRLAAGRSIVGKGGLGCISCHDIAGIPNTGTRGPDLATINQRVRYDWYERWLHQPLRMAPGTRMPQAFVGNKSTLTTVLKGDPEAQAEAMWAYLSLGPGLPLPEGMEPPKGLIIAIKERPEVLRTFMPEAGSKAIAVGYPGSVSVAFSADQCRLAYGWAGNFLDASPVWNNRGGSPAKLLGRKFWNGPAGHPWGLTVNPRIPPDFLGRASSPVFGAPLPLEPARTYDGPRAVQFEGYSLDKYGYPTFRYRLQENNKGALLAIAETPTPLKSGVATGLSRKFEADLPAGYRAWLLAGSTGGEIRVVRARDTAIIKPSRDAARSFVLAEGARIVLPSDGGKAIVLEAAGAPEGTEWQFEPKRGGGRLAILRFPETKTPLKATFSLNMWGLPKDDEELLKSLSAK